MSRVLLICVYECLVPLSDKCLGMDQFRVKRLLEYFLLSTVCMSVCLRVFVYPTCHTANYDLCTFEKGLCYFTSSSGAGADNIPWIRRRGSTSSGSTGPSVDHTLNTAAGKLESDTI